MLLSLRAYAKYRKEKGLQGGTLGAVQKAIKAGRIKVAAGGKIDPAKADAAWEQNSDRRQQRPAKCNGGAALVVTRPLDEGPEPDETDEGSFNEAQRQHEWEKVRKERLARKVREGKLVDVEDVRREWERHIDAVKNRLLLLESKVPPEARAIVAKEVRSALHELSEYDDAA